MARIRSPGKPFPGWDGIVRCEALAVREPTLLRYDWRNKETDEPSVVTDVLEQIPGGTRPGLHSGPPPAASDSPVRAR